MWVEQSVVRTEALRAQLLSSLVSLSVASQVRPLGFFLARR